MTTHHYHQARLARLLCYNIAALLIALCAASSSMATPTPEFECTTTTRVVNQHLVGQSTTLAYTIDPLASTSLCWIFENSTFVETPMKFQSDNGRSVTLSKSFIYINNCTFTRSSIAINTGDLHYTDSMIVVKHSRFQGSDSHPSALVVGEPSNVLMNNVTLLVQNNEYAFVSSSRDESQTQHVLLISYAFWRGQSVVQVVNNTQLGGWCGKEGSGVRIHSSEISGSTKVLVSGLMLQNVSCFPGNGAAVSLVSLNISGSSSIEIEKSYATLFTTIKTPTTEGLVPSPVTTAALIFTTIASASMTGASSIVLRDNFAECDGFNQAWGVYVAFGNIKENSRITLQHNLFEVSAERNANVVAIKSTILRDSETRFIMKGNIGSTGTFRGRHTLSTFFAADVMTLWIALLSSATIGIPTSLQPAEKSPLRKPRTLLDAIDLYKNIIADGAVLSLMRNSISVFSLDGGSSALKVLITQVSPSPQPATANGTFTLFSNNFTVATDPNATTMTKVLLIQRVIRYLASSPVTMVVNASHNIFVANVSKKPSYTLFLLPISNQLLFYSVCNTFIVGGDGEEATTDPTPNGYFQVNYTTVVNITNGTDCGEDKSTSTPAPSASSGGGGTVWGPLPPILKTTCEGFACATNCKTTKLPNRVCNNGEARGCYPMEFRCVDSLQFNAAAQCTYSTLTHYEVYACGRCILDTSSSGVKTYYSMQCFGNRAYFFYNCQENCANCTYAQEVKVGACTYVASLGLTLMARSTPFRCNITQFDQYGPPYDCKNNNDIRRIRFPPQMVCEADYVRNTSFYYECQTAATDTPSQSLPLTGSPSWSHSASKPLTSSRSLSVAPSSSETYSVSPSATGGTPSTTQSVSSSPAKDPTNTATPRLVSSSATASRPHTETGSVSPLKSTTKTVGRTTSITRSLSLSSSEPFSSWVPQPPACIPPPCPHGMTGEGCTASCPTNPLQIRNGTNGVVVCSGHGYCGGDANTAPHCGICLCTPPFCGDHCQFSDAADCGACPNGTYGDGCLHHCPGGVTNTTTCSGHGICLDGRLGSGLCVCGIGYTGASCEFHACPIPYGKQCTGGNGPCALIPGTCECGPATNVTSGAPSPSVITDTMLLSSSVDPSATTWVPVVTSTPEPSPNASAVPPTNVPPDSPVTPTPSSVPQQLEVRARCNVSTTDILTFLANHSNVSLDQLSVKRITEVSDCNGASGNAVNGTKVLVLEVAGSERSVMELQQIPQAVLEQGGIIAVHAAAVEAPPPTPSNAPGGGDGDDPNLGLIFGATFGAVGVCLLIAGLVFVARKKRLQSLRMSYVGGNEAASPFLDSSKHTKRFDAIGRMDAYELLNVPAEMDTEDVAEEENGTELQGVTMALHVPEAAVDELDAIEAAAATDVPPKRPIALEELDAIEASVPTASKRNNGGLDELVAIEAAAEEQLPLSNNNNKASSMDLQQSTTLPPIDIEELDVIEANAAESSNKPTLPDLDELEAANMDASERKSLSPQQQFAPIDVDEIEASEAATEEPTKNEGPSPPTLDTKEIDNDSDLDDLEKPLPTGSTSKHNDPIDVDELEAPPPPPATTSDVVTAVVPHEPSHAAATSAIDTDQDHHQEEEEHPLL